MFRRLLIANRGEVAVRVARTARRLGIETVGVVSQADAGASWTRWLDRTVTLGPASPSESYLQMERVVQAGVQHGCGAVHPGWGFLAERSVFAALCEQHGMSFLGPTPAIMERLGRKLPAKAAMAAAGLSGIPGGVERLTSADEAIRIADEIGYPVMLKADSGGGGRGMRLCRDASQLRSGFSQARAEAEAAFGDGGLYVEKYLEGGRHVEVQILVDRFGRGVHLGERDCTVQRNHQKLIEESPCPVLEDDERAELGQRAAAAAAAIGYRGAGTIEMLRSEDGRLHFMEMNARLQVEHPVSELVAHLDESVEEVVAGEHPGGVDLVAEQLRIAAHRPISFEQHQLSLRGHAIECRINAEDPADGFRPTPGRVERFSIPDDLGPGRLRVDSHLETGDEVPPHYDSLIAKVIAWGEDREQAIATLLRALEATEIEGVATTVPFHRAVLASDAFVSGDYDTATLPGWPPA